MTIGEPASDYVDNGIPFPRLRAPLTKSGSLIASKAYLLCLELPKFNRQSNFESVFQTPTTTNNQVRHRGSQQGNENLNVNPYRSY